MSEQFAGVEELLPPTTLRYLPFWIYFGIFVFPLFSVGKIKIHFLVIAIFFSSCMVCKQGYPSFYLCLGAGCCGRILRNGACFRNVIAEVVTTDDAIAGEEIATPSV